MLEILDIAYRRALGCACALAFLVPFAGAHAATFKVLYTFSGGNDGASPEAILITDGAGNLYGTTVSGGANGFGTVFKLAPNGTESVLQSFGTGSYGGTPYGSLIEDKKGNLYGTNSQWGDDGGGTVFTLKPNGAVKVLHAFDVFDSDGVAPYAGLIRKNGNLYGTTINGGQSGAGTVFEVTPGGVETVLYSFKGNFDGFAPYSCLISMDGNFYGTTNVGGKYSDGTVFEVAPDGTETTVYTFGTNAGDGFAPYGGLIADKNGNFYGTTLRGGAQNGGTVFEVATDGTESILHSFSGGSDGMSPYAGLISDRKGNLYGTTLAGGGNGCSNGEGCGTVFRIAPTGKETILYAFSGGTDGATPEAGLIVDGAGNLYGAASRGASGYGTVFELVK